jgi:hypothetical protein
VAYDDWDSQFHGVFDNVPGADYLSSEEHRYAESLFEAGFTHTGAEYERMGMSEDAVQAIRDEYFDFMGIDAHDFDWEGWREAMGYE